jgi:hypothetical protein
VDSLVQAFETHVKATIETASTRTLAILQSRLEIGKTSVHLIDSNPANSKVLRGIDKLFKEQMTEAGYDALVDAYVGRFSTQFRFFNELLAIVAPGRSVDFTTDDKAWFKSQQLASADSLKAVVDIAGALAQQRVLFGVGGMPIADLAEVLAERFQQTLPMAARLADTAMTVFYRSISERGFADIERGLPADSIRYKYYGPLDRLTRPFCAHLEESGKTYSRAEIDLMNNHQLPNVFLTCGGFRCRHMWLISGLATPAPLSQGS